MYIAITAVVIFLILMFLPDALKKAEEADKRAAEKKARNSNNVDAQSAQPSVK
jgi:uncharacterized membrane protein